MSRLIFFDESNFNFLFQTFETKTDERESSSDEGNEGEDDLWGDILGKD